MRRDCQVLLIDADDTLWENNPRFKRTITAFVELIASLGHEPGFVRDRVNRAEEENIQRRGYGTASFLLTLEQVYTELAGARASEAVRREIRGLRRLLIDAPLRLFEGVEDTLAYLSGRHRLFLFSKGNDGEQRQKVESSGLAAHFEAVEIVPEKNEAAYRGVVERRGLGAGAVWMVGDSPRSDINPALAAGLNAIHIECPDPWHFEQEAIRPGEGELLRLKRFRELREHF
ncbi:MAG: HAD family hydrolase [Terriglobia bacterium]